VRWTEHVAHIGNKSNAYTRPEWKKSLGIRRFERVVLKWILNWQGVRVFTGFV
jgi:hypothetical protein